MLVCAAAASAGEAVAQVLLSEERVVVSDVLPINSAGLDYSPRYYQDGIVYVSTRAGKLKRRIKTGKGRSAVTQLWYAELDSLGMPMGGREFLPELKTRGNEGPFCFSADLQQLYLTRAAPVNRRARRSRNDSRLQLFVSHRDGEAWSAPQLLDLGADATTADAHPALSADGELLIFASDREGGYGGMDLWGATRAGDGWGVPFNLGKLVNSAGNELFPFLHDDGTLYYSTTAAVGTSAGGGLDLVYTRLERGGWMKPLSMGPGFNSPGDDISIVVDQQRRRGFFSSTRPGGLGADDLYAFEIFGQRSNVRVELLVEVIDAATGLPLQGAAVTYVNADQTPLSEALAEGIVSVAGDPLQVVGGVTEMTDIYGRRLVAAVGGEYLLKISREGYEQVQLPVTLTGARMVLPIRLSPKQVCANVRISIVDESTLAPVVGAQLQIEPQGETLLAPTQELSSGRDGFIDYCLPCGDLYALTASVDERVGKPAVFDGRNPQCAQGESTTLTLYVPQEARLTAGGRLAGTPLSVGTSLQLPSVFYRLNDYALSAGAKRDLDGLVELLTRYPETRIELGSHTDALGDAAFNQQLSQRRAEEARRYVLESSNIDPARVVAVGYGESALRNGCRDGIPCSAAAHRENRRTEVVILGPNEAGGSRLGSRDSGRHLSAAPAAKATETTRRSTNKPQPAAPGEHVSRSEYLVVAGSYESEATANAQAQQLLALGYANVRVETVDGLPGTAVVAGRFSKLSEAAQFSRALREAHGMTAYVRKVSP